MQKDEHGVRPMVLVPLAGPTVSLLSPADAPSLKSGMKRRMRMKKTRSLSVRAEVRVERR